MFVQFLRPVSSSVLGHRTEQILYSLVLSLILFRLLQSDINKRWIAFRAVTTDYESLLFFSPLPLSLPFCFIHTTTGATALLTCTAFLLSFLLLLLLQTPSLLRSLSNSLFFSLLIQPFVSDKHTYTYIRTFKLWTTADRRYPLCVKYSPTTTSIKPWTQTRRKHNRSCHQKR